MKRTGLTYQELESIARHDPRRGWEIGRRFRGRMLELTTLRDGFKASGKRTELEPEDTTGFASLVVWVGAEETQDPDQPLADVWTLEGNDLEKTVWASPLLQSKLAEYGVADFARFRADVEAVLRGEKDRGEIVTETATPAGQYVDALITQLAEGLETFPVSQFVLRRELTLASNTNIRPAYDHVGRVLTTAELTVDESVPDTLKFALPNGEWLKRTPTVTQTAADKWLLTQEWWHADYWSELIYKRRNDP